MTQQVKAVYLDTRTHKPATEATPYNGTVLPHEELEVYYTDTFTRPVYLYGTLPDDVNVDDLRGVWPLSDDEKDKLLSKRKDKLHKMVHNQREKVLTGGIEVTVSAGTFSFSTKDRSRTLVDQSALDAKESDDSWEKRWKTMSGDYVVIDKSDMEKIRKVVAKHVEACFNREEELKDKIDSISELEDLKGIKQKILKDGWPETVS